MSAIPWSYAVRNLWARRVTTLLTAIGMALVVFVFTAVLMLGAGLEATLVATGSSENLLMTREGAETEVQSSISREHASILLSDPGVATMANGAKWASRESVILIALPKRGADRPGNVTLRGIEPAALTLRPQVRLVAGRLFESGRSEVITGRAIANGFTGAGLGESLRFGLREWRVVGVFDAGRTAFGSEIWGDANQFMQAYRRNTYSVVLMKLLHPEQWSAVAGAFEADPRLQVKAQPETVFYAAQAEVMSTFLRILGWVLSLIFSVAAVIGATITMYASVAARTAEIGTLRAIGFRRRAVFLSFLMESLFLGGVGGVLGILSAASLSRVSVSTMNWQTFSEVSFRFELGVDIVVSAMLFALAMGIVGGALPALRASRLDILTALRAA